MVETSEDGQYMSEENISFMLAIERTFESINKSFVWDVKADNYSNPYIFIPILFKRLGKKQSTKENGRVMDGFSKIAKDLRAQDIQLKCTEAMMTTVGPDNWAFGLAAFHVLGLSNSKLKLPKSIYDTLSEHYQKDYVCIFEDEEVSFENYLNHFFDLVLISRNVPSELINGVATTYKFEEKFLSMIPMAGYNKIREVEKFYTIDISRLFTNNLGSLYCALSAKPDSTVFETFSCISLKDMVDMRKILVLSDILTCHLIRYETENGSKYPMVDIEGDDLGFLLLQGFAFEVRNRIASWRRSIFDAGHRRKSFNEIDNRHGITTYFSVMQAASRMMAAIVNIYANSYGISRTLADIFRNLDEFLLKNEVASARLREMLTKKY